jgi:hypothetical protein
MRKWKAAAEGTRHELRGRLDARRAKVRAYGVAEESALAELAPGGGLLYTRPSALDRAAAVAAYEKTPNCGYRP